MSDYQIEVEMVDWRGKKVKHRSIAHWRIVILICTGVLIRRGNKVTIQKANQ